MADNVVQWPGTHDGDSRGRSRRPPGQGRLWPELERLIDSLPERFRDAGRLLADSLAMQAYKQPKVSDQETEEASWCTDLEPEEAWAIAEAFRRSLTAGEVWTEAEPGPEWDPAELHAALDRALLAASLASRDRLSRSHRRVLEDVSHDLRSPLNSILFLADALRAERSGPLTDDQMRQVGVLYTAAVTLVKMVNDLIDFARLGDREHIRVATTSFSVESVLADVLGLLGPLVSHREVKLRTEVIAEGLRSGDPQLLSRVLLNLMSNAVQAVDEEGTVLVRVDETGSGDLRTEICDDRLGTDIGHLRGLISDAEAGKLPGETRGWTHGLGLSITARLVKVAGGRIHVASRPGEGTVFTVELPFQRL